MILRDVKVGGLFRFVVRDGTLSLIYQKVKACKGSESESAEVVLVSAEEASWERERWAPHGEAWAPAEWRGYSWERTRQRWEQRGSAKGWERE